MKISIEELLPGQEEEIIIRCESIDPEMMKLIQRLRDKGDNGRVTCFDGEHMKQMPANHIMYFEAVDERVYAYFEKEVLEVKLKLYEIEERFNGENFFRAGKSVIVNLSKVKHFTPGFNGRFEALMLNGERVMISRSYVPELKKRLGVGK